MGDYRKGVDYRDGGEIKIDDPGQPLSLLDSWISEAKERGLVEPNAMSISTVSPSGSPRSRMVLLKICLLYTSPSPRDRQKSRMPSSA